MTLVIGLILIWLLARVFLRVASGAIHVLLIVAAAVFVWGLVRGTNNPVFAHGIHMPHFTRSR